MAKSKSRAPVYMNGQNGPEISEPVLLNSTAGRENGEPETKPSRGSSLWLPGPGEPLLCALAMLVDLIALLTGCFDDASTKVQAE